MLLATSLPHTKCFCFFFSLKYWLWSAASKTAYFFLVREEQLSLNSSCYLPGLLHLRHFLVVLRMRHWNINEKFNDQLLWWSSKMFRSHISVNICLELFSFLKNPKFTCLFCVVVAVVNVFQTSSRRIFCAGLKSIIVVFEARVLYFQM